ncbi:large ribosomal subunit protein mL38-like [Physella acuta]|uniref:large ribosomal subunit protein mL38-like n=1 Tax=Physella acuta TaxID=109671 RepID=UPI0027DB0896|nr:large ribosomal subunit protein mL38-like [Physella acuta]
MATCMTLSLRSRVGLGTLTKTSKILNFQPVRYRWKPPDRDAEILPSFAERLASWKTRYQHPASYGINIGLPLRDNYQGKQLELTRQWMKQKAPLELLALRRELNVDLEKVKEEWFKESMPTQVKKVAEHYGIFQDLFDGAHFYPVVPLDIWFDYDEEFITPVRYGNHVEATEAAIQPSVFYEADDDSYWTLVLTSPDGNLADSKQELLHWFIGNIPGKNVDQGEVICDYLQPFPPKGVGFLRYVFVLYKQKGKIDFKDLQRSKNCVSLRERSFNTLEFYRNHENHLTPAGLSFFQSEWDKSVKSVFHNVLDMKEPVFEFIHPPVYAPEQKDYPHKEPFNLYLDLYRDVKDLQEEVLKEKLKGVDPTKPPQPRPQYPNVDMLPKTTPSWLRAKVQNMRLGKQHWRAMYRD